MAVARGAIVNYHVDGGEQQNGVAIAAAIVTGLNADGTVNLQVFYGDGGSVPRDGSYARSHVASGGAAGQYEEIG
jgi:hypothetical protein